jgi:hypothetical protein
MLALIILAVAQGEMTLTQALMIAITTLASVVAVLFIYLRSIDARQQKRLDECEDDRRALWQAVVDLGGTHPTLRRKT